MNIANEKVLIFGGSFNPPTTAHQEIVSKCLALDGFSQLWLMLSGDRADKQYATTDYDRLVMLGLMKHEVFKDDPRLVITDFELKLPRPTQTYRTLGRLVLSNPGTDFWFVYGADAYQAMPSWQHGQELRQALNMVVINRGDNPVPENDGLICLQLEQAALVSSTEARQATICQQRLGDYVCQSVAAYIKSQQLYCEPTTFST